MNHTAQFWGWVGEVLHQPLPEVAPEIPEVGGCELSATHMGKLFGKLYKKEGSSVGIFQHNPNQDVGQ